MARPTKYKKEYCDKIIKYFDVPPQRTEYRRTFYADGMLKSEEPVTKPAVFPTFQGFANLIGVNITTLHEWRRNYPEFSQAFARAKQIQESIEHHQGLKGEAAKKAAIEMLGKVGIPDPERRYEQYPHEFSGGMRQRVVIAIAAACRPQILICDEPTTALDVTIQAQILQLIRDLQKELGMSVIYITHDLGVVANVADRVAVMYAGQIVEYGTVQEIFYDAWHPYTWALLQALPQLGTKGESLPTVDGTPPNLFNEIHGDAFAPRNKHALAIDFVAEPPFFQVSETHAAKTWYLDPRAPKIERPHSIQNLREKMGKMGGSNLNG